MTPEAKALILRAARRYHEDSLDTRYKSLVRGTRISAFGEVAADVLVIAMTPFAFEMAIRTALESHPMPGGRMTNADVARLERAEWAEKFVAEVAGLLGEGDR